MKAIIEGKRYNTETAKPLFDCRANVGRSDFSWWAGTVYRTPRGAYFLAGEGHAASRFAESLGNSSYGSGAGIQPLTVREALGLAEQHADTDTIERYFGEQIEDARGPGRPAIGPDVHLNMPQELIDRIDEEAAARGLSRAEMIRVMTLYALSCTPIGSPRYEPNLDWAFV